MQIARPKPPRLLISLVAMIDVLMIMLVFFMVTSTYLNLDMVPVAESGDGTPERARIAANEGTGGDRILVRLGGDGVAYIRGRPFTAVELATFLATRMAARPETLVIVLPSGNADIQALVAVMDAATEAGVRRLRIVRLEARP